MCVTCNVINQNIIFYCKFDLQNRIEDPLKSPKKNEPEIKFIGFEDKKAKKKEKKRKYESD